MDAHTWIIHQLERGTSAGWYTSTHAEQMTTDAGILTRNTLNVRTRKANNAITWITKTLTYGVIEGWYTQDELNNMLQNAGLTEQPTSIPQPQSQPTQHMDPGIAWRWLNGA